MLPKKRIPVRDRPLRHFLRAWREKKGMSPDELAMAVGVERSAISRYETGERGISIDLQFEFCRALGISLSQFFSHPDQPSFEAEAEALLNQLSPEQRDALMTVMRDLAKARGIDSK